VRGDDTVCCAKTGSGKTLAFLLPAFRRVLKERQDPAAGPCELVLAPTRELATQIGEVAEQFGACAEVRTAVLFGGVPKPPQVKALKAKPHLVVATPGRLVDLSNDKAVALGNVVFLVLDEADRMLDMGFEPQMEKIMAQIRAERQTLLFSATWPKAVQKLATKYLKKDFVHVNVGETEELAANKAVTQEFFKLDDDEKENKLWRLMYDMGEGTKIIIFANTKNRINNLQKAVWNAGYDCVAMHGDKTQWERDEGLAKFTKGEIPVMLATDVCARGLDIKDVSHVLNFDMARDVESYIHRIGRTGRAGNSGTSITFFNEAYDTDCAPALAKIAREAGQAVPAFLERAAEKGAKSKNKQWKY
jgi:superfamily II DNA/RNA helicase